MRSVIQQDRELRTVFGIQERTSEKETGLPDGRPIEQTVLNNIQLYTYLLSFCSGTKKKLGSQRLCCSSGGGSLDDLGC